MSSNLKFLCTNYNKLIDISGGYFDEENWNVTLSGNFQLGAPQFCWNIDSQIDRWCTLKINSRLGLERYYRKIKFQILQHYLSRFSLQIAIGNDKHHRHLEWKFRVCKCIFFLVTDLFTGLYQFRFNLECRLMAAEEGLIEEDDAPAWLLLTLGLTERIVKDSWWNSNLTVLFCFMGRKFYFD